MSLEDTIFAVATSPGASVRALLRLSGAGVADIIHAITRPAQAWTRGVHRARLQLGSRELPVLLLIFDAPRSYTGEQTAEILTVANPTLLSRIETQIVETARGLGLHARSATPGEFTARAFFNGRMSLSQAEGVAAIIAARSDAELRAARLLAGNALGALSTQLADELAQCLALVEAGIDFTDQEDVVAILPADLAARLLAISQQIETQLERAAGGESVTAAPWVVLAGPPNAGKSTLFNALLGRSRSIVSNVPGTTRDMLAEPVTLCVGARETAIVLVDLAGLDDAKSGLNPRMQAVAREAIARADLVLRCAPVPATEPCGSGDLNVLTKADEGDRAVPGHVTISAHTGRGLDELRREIITRLDARASTLAEDVSMLLPRHEALLHSALDRLREAVDLLLPHADRRQIPMPELVAASLRSALDDLGNLSGAQTPDDVLGRIFAGFCIGK